MKTDFLLLLMMASSLTGACQKTNTSKKSGSNDPAIVNNETTVKFKTLRIDGLDIFYREAGNKSNPTILFLHGFPSSSHMYRDIMNDFASSYHVIAPDYPGFGLSSNPKVDEYKYTFDNLSVTMDHFIDALELKELSLYLQDYGGPVGFRIAARRPTLIKALIIQNANAYTEGLGEAVSPLVNYFTNPTEETERGAREILTTTKWQYTNGAEDVSKISPDSYIIDQFYLDRPGNVDIQLALFKNYGSNIALYDTWHSYFRTHQPATLVVWGANDKIFISPGASAYKKDIKNAQVHLLNGGHFLLEEHHAYAATLIDDFLKKVYKRK